MRKQQKASDRAMTPEERVLWRRYRRDVEEMRIMDDVFCEKPDEMLNEAYAQRARELKQMTEGKMTMCRIMERVKARGVAEGRAEGRAEMARELARKLLALGKMTIAEIAACAGLSLDEVRALAAE